METALLIAIDDAQPFDEVRREFAVQTFGLGIPFHVTLLYPFALQVTDTVIAEAREFFAGRPAFEFQLTRIAVWPRVVYAVPEPDDTLRECMEQLFARFPEWPPYGGVHDNVIPHATLGEEIDAPAVRDEIERRVAPHLPHRCQARDVALWEEITTEHWRERDRFPLAA